MKNILRANGLLGAVLLGLSLLLTGCDKDDDKETTVLYGPETFIGEGAVRAWVKVTPDRKPVEIGVSMSKDVVPSLPNEMTVYTLGLPEGVELPPYNHVMLDWNPQGHPPMEYVLPHFDVHFYTVPVAEREAVVPGPQGHTPEFEEKYIPAGYVSGMEVVPNMGVHWMDGSSPELNGEVFTKTFIYGANNNKIIFYEPMLTLAYLQSLDPNRKDMQPVKQAPQVQQVGYHPGAYVIYNNTEENTFEIYLTDMKYREPVK
ncbi:DUF5602 domain-containing protein [Pontibacter actiniarum]|uniref:TTHB210-like domain-containing protein n=1 Tax=Pontibacter actiniarum TaxID=323450 RepID=A0A1X9YWK9_9BACT|nr:DUF5602 domain-containing protein [Pontibacter actiniarum]ARS37248.1 hypothetical protein CA264_18465 [Pontibacter actiniarum]